MNPICLLLLYCLENFPQGSYRCLSKGELYQQMSKYVCFFLYSVVQLFLHLFVLPCFWLCWQMNFISYCCFSCQFNDIIVLIIGLTFKRILRKIFIEENCTIFPMVLISFNTQFHVVISITTSIKEEQKRLFIKTTSLSIISSQRIERFIREYTNQGMLYKSLQVEHFL